jgi:hypothetical protein
LFITSSNLRDLRDLRGEGLFVFFGCGSAALASSVSFLLGRLARLFQYLMEQGEIHHL